MEDYIGRGSKGKLYRQTSKFSSPPSKVTLYCYRGDDPFVTLADLSSAQPYPERFRGGAEGGTLPDASSLHRVGKLQLIELPRRGRGTTRPVSGLVSARFSYESVSNFDHGTIYSNRSITRSRERIHKSAMHSLSFADGCDHASATGPARATRRSYRMRELSRTGGRVVTISYPEGLHLCDAGE